MELAKHLLDASPHSIKEIAHQCGFNGLAGFSRKFRQEFGKSPSSYRKSRSNNAYEPNHWNLPLNETDVDQLIQLKSKYKWLEKLLVTILNNLDNESFYMEQLASNLSMSASNLNRKVQGLFPFSAMRLLRDLRLQYAAELLTMAHTSVTETAMLAGFFDAAHLSRYFKKTFGCAPGEYKQVTLSVSFINKLKESLAIQIDK